MFYQLEKTHALDRTNVGSTLCRSISVLVIFRIEHNGSKYFVCSMKNKSGFTTVSNKNPLKPVHNTFTTVTPKQQFYNLLTQIDSIKFIRFMFLLIP